MNAESVENAVDEDFTCYDLRQENDILRAEIQTLCSALADARMNTGSANSSIECATQTEDDEKKVIESKLHKFENDLLHERKLNLDHARQAREMEARLREQDGKILSQNLEIMHALPLKVKVQELQLRNDELHIKNQQISQENVRQELQLKNQAAEAEKFASTQRQKEERILQLNDDCNRLQQSLSGANEVSHYTIIIMIPNLFSSHIEAERDRQEFADKLVKNESLIKEYQKKLRESDVQAIENIDKINYLERKCQSQGQHILKMQVMLSKIPSARKEESPSSQIVERTSPSTETDRAMHRSNPYNMMLDQYKAAMSRRRQTQLHSNEQSPDDDKKLSTQPDPSLDYGAEGCMCSGNLLRR